MMFAAVLGLATPTFGAPSWCSQVPVLPRANIPACMDSFKLEDPLGEMPFWCKNIPEDSRKFVPACADGNAAVFDTSPCYMFEDEQSCEKVGCEWQPDFCKDKTAVFESEDNDDDDDDDDDDDSSSSSSSSSDDSSSSSSSDEEWDSWDFEPDMPEMRPQTGEDVCEGKGFGPKECNEVSACCEFDDGRCWSAVGKQICFDPPAEKPGHGHHHGKGKSQRVHLRKKIRTKRVKLMEVNAPMEFFQHGGKGGKGTPGHGHEHTYSHHHESHRPGAEY